ncbi:MAG: hypothetical protein GY835_05760 [bacterium]|nr:hypothetical protein [bacterium]
MNAVLMGKAIQHLVPGAEFTIEGDDYDGIRWLDLDNVCPSRDEIERELQRMGQERQETAYQSQRRAAYLRAGLTPEALLVALWEAVVEERDDGLIELQAKREAIKSQYPRGGA